VVKEELEKLGLKVEKVVLGEALISADNLDIYLPRIKVVLESNGFELIDDKQAKVIENIKIAVIDLIHYKKENDRAINISKYLADKLGMSYQYLSTLFSSMEGITIEKYIINQKIEKVKELLIYDDLTLSEISYKLNYSSVQHLSNQFKKITGFTPTEFKHLKEKNRIPLDKLG